VTRLAPSVPQIVTAGDGWSVSAGGEEHDPRCSQGQGAAAPRVKLGTGKAEVQVVAVVRETLVLPPGTRRNSVLLVVVLAIVAAVCQAGLWGAFAWDDRELVVSNVILAPEASAFDAFAAPFWRKDSEVGIHLASCALLFVVCLRFGASPTAATLAGLLFGLSPRLSENVFWVSGRTDLLAGFFVIFALAVYPRDAESSYRRLLAGAVLLCGLLAKEVAVAGVAALTALELSRNTAPGAVDPPSNGRKSASLESKLGGLLIRLSPIYLALAVYLVLRQAAIADSAEPLAAMALSDRLMLGAESLGRYILMWLDPLRPALRIGSVRAPRDPSLIGLGLATAGSTLWLLRWSWCSAPSRLAFASLVMVIVSLGLVLHLVPIHLDVIASDRLLYLPTLGLGMFFATIATGLDMRRARAAVALGCAVCVAFAWSVTQRADAWSDELALWLTAKQTADAYDSSPDAWIARLLLERDEPALALLYLQDAIRIETASPVAPARKSKTLDRLSKISTALSDLGRYPDALHAIDQVVDNDPNNPGHQTTRVVMMARAMRLDEAAAEAKRVLQLPGLSPSDASQLNNVVAMRDAWLRLPEPTPAESPSLRIARARVFEALGALRRAELTWREILADPSIGEAEVYEATRFFCFRSSIESAEPVLARLIEMNGAHFEDAMRLADHLREKRRIRAPQQPPTMLAAKMHALAAR
jgi:tetratricopeptide (TPR) repeat protein